MGSMSILSAMLWAPALFQWAAGMSDEVFIHSLNCDDLPDDNSTLKDLRPCTQIPIKAILVDGRCDYREIDEGR